MLFSKRKDILSNVKGYINNHLNPAKVNFYDSSRDTVVHLKSVSEVLEVIDITEEEYKTALQISDDQDFKIISNVQLTVPFSAIFDIGLPAWEANIDIQPQFSYYRALRYMCSYLSKEEDESSQAMKAI